MQKKKIRFPAFCLATCKRKKVQVCKNIDCPYWNYRLYFVRGLWNEKRQYVAFYIKCDLKPEDLVFEVAKKILKLCRFFY